MGARSRRKGARGEREVAEILRPVFPSARRRSSGEEAQEDQGRDLKGTPGLCVQVAVGARPPIYEKLAEAERAARSPAIPVAFTRRDQERWLVHLRADDFVSLLLAAARGASSTSEVPYAGPASK